MGKKKYYCDFCNRYFNDDRNTRFKHLNSVGHKNAKKEHYNMFRDPETLLREESDKKPCRKYHYEGFCPFGGSCTYSHYSREDLDAIRQELIYTKQKEEWNKPTVDSWLAKYTHNIEVEKEKNKKLLWSSELPPELLMNSSLLPPSLLPFHIQEYINADLESWG